MATFWLSYAEEGNFLGACIVEGDDFVGACIEAKRVGLSPGGQVLGVDLDASMVGAVPEGYRGRLLDATQVKKLEGIMEGHQSNPSERLVWSRVSGTPSR